MKREREKNGKQWSHRSDGYPWLWSRVCFYWAWWESCIEILMRYLLSCIIIFLLNTSTVIYRNPLLLVDAFKWIHFFFSYWKNKIVVYEIWINKNYVFILTVDWKCFVGKGLRSGINCLILGRKIYENHHTCRFDLARHLYRLYLDEWVVKHRLITFYLKRISNLWSYYTSMKKLDWN